MKTLYAILGIGAEASAEEVAAGYQRMLAAFPNDPALLDDDRRAQLVALREAYATLSDPIKRGLYDQQRRVLSQRAPQAYGGYPQVTAIDEAKVSGTFSILKILVAGFVAIIAILVYTSHAREQERLRIEKEREIALKEIQIQEERQQLAAQEQLARLERQARMEQVAQEERSRREAQQAIREVDARERQFQRDEESRKRQEAAEKKQQERDAEYQRQRAQQDMDRQAARLRALAHSR